VPDRAHRAGVVALLGPTNAGKSTLLNRLLGQKLAIVTPRPQTTRSRILGILSLSGAQVALLDTPGFHEAARPLNRLLNEQVAEAARDCDGALLLVDPRTGWEPEHARLAGELGRRGAPFLAVVTKDDLAPGAGAGVPGDLPVLRVSARTGEGLRALRESLPALVPESPPLYPEDQLTDRPLRFLAAECVREAAFGELSQELPYAVAVEVEEFDEKRPDLVRVRANLLVERASQKGIAVGAGGRVIKQIGIQARREIEALVGRKVHLELWVKVEPRWSRRPKRLKSLGYW